MTEKLDWVAAAGVAVAALILFPASGSTCEQRAASGRRPGKARTRPTGEPTAVTLQLFVCVV